MSKSYQEGGRRRKTVKRGGSGASDYALKVYGAGDQQHAAGSYGNLIAANHVTGGRKKSGKKGGNPLTTVAVPAILIAANHLYKRKGNKTLKNYKRGGAGAQDIMNMAAGAMQNLNNTISGNTTPPTHIIQTGAGAPLSSSFGVPVASAGPIAGGGKKKGGSGALAEIALPAVLIAANRLYKKDKHAYGSRKHRISGGKKH